MIRDNLTHILDTIEQTARNAGRDSKEIQLVAVSKLMSIEQIQQAIDCGQILFGESYLQEASKKIQHFPQKIRWHFIGHLQSNKAKQAAELFDVVETVDRFKVAQALDNHAKLLKKELSILVQVNTGREKQKSGILPEEAEPLLRLISKETNLHILGLMTMPPFFPDPEKSRPYFRELRDLAETLAAQHLFENNHHVELSMGMSGDYAVAIEEGATIVRVGTALFGTRNPTETSL
jgi:pyridoxal phosphate enzyme (YggS family)